MDNTQPIRLGKEILSEVRKLAQAEGRTIRSQVERLLRGALDSGTKDLGEYRSKD